MRSGIRWALSCMIFFVASFPLAAQAALVAHYPLDGNAVDSSGNGYDGVVNGAVATMDRNSVPNAAMAFNGTSDVIVIPDDPAFSPHVNGEISVTAWVRVNAINTDAHNQVRQPVVSKGGIGDWEWALYVFDDLSVGFSTWNANGNPHLEIQGGTIQLGRWHHVAGVYRDNILSEVYLDGVLVASGSNFLAVANDGTRDVWIGGRSDGQYLNADIDDVRIYDNALDALQVRALANFGNSHPIPGLGVGGKALLVLFLLAVGLMVVPRYGRA